MSKPGDVITALVNQLKNSSELASVADDDIFLGARENTNFPCLIVEPMQIQEKEYVFPLQRLTFQIAVIGFINVQDDVDKQIVGDANNQGILDLENAVKKAISADITLGGTAKDVVMNTTVYEYADYPVRGFTINVEVLFEQASTGRT